MNYEDDHKEEDVDTDKIEEALEDEAVEDDEDDSAPGAGHEADTEEGYE